MNVDKFYALLKNPAFLSQHSIADIAELVKQYPYAANFQLMYLLKLWQLNDHKAQEALAVAAMYAGDRARLKQWITYIENPPKSESKQQEAERGKVMKNKTALLKLLRERMQAIENEKTKEETVAPLPQTELIERFLSEQPTISRPDKQLFFDPQKEAVESIKEDSSALVSETLANIYVQQGLLQKAIHCFEKLILKYPEKSSYFAVRINELNKNVKHG